MPEQSRTLVVDRPTYRKRLALGWTLCRVAGWPGVMLAVGLLLGSRPSRVELEVTVERKDG